MIQIRSHGIVLFFLATVISTHMLAPAQAQVPEAPKWAYAFDLSCRKFGELEFTKDTKKYGVEVFLDPNNGNGVYINLTGEIAIVPNFSVTPPLEKSVAPKWTSGLDLKTRKAGELEFTDKTKTYGMEVFFDTNSNNWIYITETGSMAVAPGRLADSGDLKSPQWLHSVDLKVRKGGIKDWDSKEVKAYGIEVYQDLNNGNLVYICQTGSIAIVPSKAFVESENKAPDWMHGQDLQCRKYGQANFDPDTPKYGVEIFRDGNNGNWIFISEIGDIAVTPGNKDAESPTKNPQDAKFTHGLDLSCRKAGEVDFTASTKTYALEGFVEDNVDCTLYIVETGAIAAAAKK